MLIVLGVKKELSKSDITIPVILLFSSYVINYVYAIISNDFVGADRLILYLLLYVAGIVLYLLTLNNNKIRILNLFFNFISQKQIHIYEFQYPLWERCHVTWRF